MYIKKDKMEIPWLLTIDVQTPCVLNLWGRHHRILCTTSQDFSHVAHFWLEPQSAGCNVATVTGLQNKEEYVYVICIISVSLTQVLSHKNCCHYFDNSFWQKYATDVDLRVIFHVET